jgi:hypothetical protein
MAGRRALTAARRNRPPSCRDRDSIPPTFHALGSGKRMESSIPMFPIRRHHPCPLASHDSNACREPDAPASHVDLQDNRHPPWGPARPPIALKSNPSWFECRRTSVAVNHSWSRLSETRVNCVSVLPKMKDTSAGSRIVLGSEVRSFKPNARGVIPLVRRFLDF